MKLNIDINFKDFKNKKVLVTGHTGFKGSWLIIWLESLGAEVFGISIDVPTFPSHFESSGIMNSISDNRFDISNITLLQETINKIKPDFIFHLAAQSLVRKSYDNPIETWNTNLMGTIKLLESIRILDNKCNVVMITSDKCYDNVEWVWGYKETDTLGGPDPYSASKGAAELAIKSYIKSYFNEKPNIRISSARAGNVIGGGDWALDRIVPDCVKAWSINNYVELRNPFSTRPWQHVLEPLSGYMVLALALSKNIDLHGESFNFGPNTVHNYCVLDLVKEMSIYWDQVKWNDISSEISGPYESALLKLNCDKALVYLKWISAMNFAQTVKMTSEWYRDYYQNSGNIKDVTLKQIQEYTSIAKSHNITWAI